MPRLLSSLVVFFGLAASGCRGDADASDGSKPEHFYSLRVLPTFEITLEPGARAKLAKAPREWVRAEFRYRDKRLSDVAVRLKGHRSMRGLDDKPSFKVRFDKFVKKQKFLGWKSLTLNGMVEDPTLVREALGYRLYREVGVPAPETAYAEVTLDGQPYGLYLMVETVDDEFLERRFDDDDGDVYEGVYGCDLYPDDVEGFEIDHGDDDRAELTSLVRTAAGPVGGMVGEEGAAFDDSALTYLAVSAYLGDFDGYRHAHNYRLYHRPDRKGARWFFLPWGIDRVFVKRLGPYDSNGLVARRCFADRDCRIAFLRQLRRVVDAAERLALDKGMTVLTSFVSEAAARDRRRPFDAAETAEARARMRTFLAERPNDLADELGCLDGDREIDRDGDGAGCMDCDDADAAVHPGAAEVVNGRDDDCSGLVDDTPAVACPEVIAGGARFQLCQLPMRWKAAGEFCAARGGQLARIDSLEQSAAVHREARRIDRKARWWIGLTDRAQEGRWLWSDGTPLEAGLWSTGQPDNGSCNQDCAVLKRDGEGRWHDTHCEQPQPFVCRMPH